MKRDQERLDKKLAETQAENYRLQETLQKAQDEVAELQKLLTNYKRDKLSLSVHTAVPYLSKLTMAMSHSQPIPPSRTSLCLDREGGGKSIMPYYFLLC